MGVDTHMSQKTSKTAPIAESNAPGQMAGLFEPWGLGDSIIAAAAMRHRPKQFVLYCSSKWHAILREACGEEAILRPAELSYTSRLQQSTASANHEQENRCAPAVISKIFSIRGDPRDWLAIRRIFPGIPVKMTGWMEFLSKKTVLLDWVYRTGFLRVRSRYLRWEQLLDLPEGSIANEYALQRGIQSKEAVPGRVILHLGAQWKSKQYPNVARLRAGLEAHGFSVRILAGPHDPLPQNIDESDVTRPSVPELIRELRSADWVIANDSGPMHLAAFLGAKTIVIPLLSNIQEWLPPGVIPVYSDRMPKGHMPISLYTTDQILEGWPEPSVIIDALLRAEARNPDLRPRPL